MFSPFVSRASPFGGMYTADPYEHELRQKQHQRRMQLRRQQELEELRQRQLFEQQQQQLYEQQQQKLYEQQQLRQQQKQQRLRCQQQLQPEQQKHDQQQQLAKRTEAAKIIARACQRAVAVRSARAITAQLRALAAVSASVDAFVATHKPSLARSTATEKDALFFADGLEKLIVRLDGVETLGSELLRARRRALVARMQEHLAYADKRRVAILDGLEDIVLGTQLARFLDGSIDAEEEAKRVRATQEAAASVLQRRVRAYLVSQRTKRRQTALKQVAAFESEARSLRDSLSALQVRVQAHTGEALDERVTLTQQLAAAIAALRL